MTKTNQRAATGLRAVLGGMALVLSITGCEQKQPVCRSPQYWSDLVRGCVGIGEYMDAHGGSYPDGYVSPDASAPEASMDAMPEASTLSCDGGQRLCGASCADTQSDPLNCGACGAACPSSANATAVCSQGRCDLRCDTGAHRCGGSCLRDNDTASCGTRCTPCPEPLGSAPSCTMGACGYTCLAGYDDTGSACEMRTARPIFPWGLSTVTMLRPTLSWELAMGLDGAQVELCRDRACSMLIERINAMGTTARPTTDLPASSVIFWRLRGRVGAATGTRTSATWQFRTPARSATMADTAHGVDLDVNGDGFSDVAVSSLEAGAVRVDVFHGSAAGLTTLPATILRPMVNTPELCTLAAIGDINGDGFGDLAVGMENSNITGASSAGVVLVYLGSNAGLSSTPLLTLEGTRANENAGRVVVGVGDANGDGFADFVDASNSGYGPTGVAGTGRVRVFLGARVPSATPATTLYPAQAEGFGSSCTVGDFNGDRLGDLVCWSWFAQPNGRATLYRGSMAGFPTVADVSIAAPSQNVMGGWVRLAGGDVNGDGLADLAVGLANATSSGGQFSAGAIAWYLSVGGVLPATPSGTIDGSTMGAQLGGGVAVAGDTNGDGYADIAVSERDTVRLFNGSASGLTELDARTLRASSPSEMFASSTAGVGDVNRDGFSDVLVGAPQATVRSMTNAGSARLYRGSAAGVGTTASQSLDGAAMNSFFGTAIAR